jgi:hypothetical protein
VSERRFTYRLESLIRLRTAERDALRTDVERATGAYQSKARECQNLSRAIELAEGELRALYRSGSELPLDGHARLQVYLKQQRELRRAKQVELEDASRAMDRAIAALELKLQDTKALESHRARKRRQFDEQETRLELNAADEQWLRRKRDA